MGMESYKQGIKGEELVEKYLSQQGYKIIERNFRSQQGEIDLVAQDGEFLVFVEVKNYSYRSLAKPAAVIRKSKKESIIHAARYYLYKNRIKNVNGRFDVVTIYRGIDGSRKIEHYRNAFFVN
jgi:putative endonuclease